MIKIEGINSKLKGFFMILRLVLGYFIIMKPFMQKTTIMTDIFTKEKRSWIMSRIRGTNTKIDLKMNEMLGNMRYKYEMYPKMFGNPDFILPRKKIVIFCDGDFWHGYRYHEKKRLAKKFWRDKIERNMRRDDFCFPKA